MIQPSPRGIPHVEFAPKRVFLPIEIGLPSVPLKTPSIEAPPPTSLPLPTMAELEIRPSTITGPVVPALKFMYEAPGITVVPAASCAPKRTLEVSKIRVLSAGMMC